MAERCETCGHNNYSVGYGGNVVKCRKCGQLVGAFRPDFIKARSEKKEGEYVHFDKETKMYKIAKLKL